MLNLPGYRDILEILSSSRVNANLKRRYFENILIYSYVEFYADSNDV